MRTRPRAHTHANTPLLYVPISHAHTLIHSCMDGETCFSNIYPDNTNLPKRTLDNKKDALAPSQSLPLDVPIDTTWMNIYVHCYSPHACRCDYHNNQAGRHIPTHAYNRISPHTPTFTQIRPRP
eukprot:GHVU01008236.1.p2 GENE.GHVU01008236.1~~GHVU01008236.1.p2  ORF type:complete len:124 (-),score=1.38 GHVU01008236.1:308-679(-)